MPLSPSHRLARALALGLLFSGAAAAQQPTPKAREADKAAELEAARAELQRAARRVAELSRELGEQHTHVFADRHALRRPVIGVLLAPDDEAGVRIAGVTPGSPAAKAGLRAGDRLLRIGGTQILGSSGELRLENARKLLRARDTRTPVQIEYARSGRTATVSVTPTLENRLVVWSGDAPMALAEGHPLPPGVAPLIRHEVMRLGDCKGEECQGMALSEALRWHGLNLASVDARLGRYFGTSEGVLVLSTGEALRGLEPGDVLRKVDGKPVRTPREAMAALHAKPAGSKVTVEYLRDRKAATVQVTVPKARPLPIPPAPPAPPKPPAPPAAPKAAPPPPPPPPPATSFEYQIAGDGGQVLIAWAAPPTVEFERVEVRTDTND